MTTKFPGSSDTATGPRGEVANRQLIEHSGRLERRMYKITDNVYCLVGNGLANVSFIRAPEGLIVVDTGESNQEMAEAMLTAREHFDDPVVAVIYSHYHYVRGTETLQAEADGPLEIWGHEGIPANMAASAAEFGPMISRGLIMQFGLNLPTEGADAMPNIGLGPFFRNPAHAPFTDGYIPQNHDITGPTEAVIAGLDIHFVQANSDSDDTVIIWLPDEKVCINNHIWPALFNVYPLRGEAYRDPTELIDGYDHILSLAPEHLVGVHGPPLSGTDEIRAEVVNYRDSIQFLWDQTVRAVNRGVRLGDLADFITLPDRFKESFRTTEFYGIAQHHTRQIHNGVRGWFDEDPATLVPLPPSEEASRIVAAIGGRDATLEQMATAGEAGDVQWAIRLGSWLLEIDPDDPEARAGTAAALRSVGQATTSANLRSWCLTRALELEGTIDLSRVRQPRAGRAAVERAAAETFVHALRVMVVPERCPHQELSVRFRFDEGDTAGLLLRGGVGVPLHTDAPATATISLSKATWAELYTGRLSIEDAAASDRLTVDGTLEDVLAFFATFDHASLGELQPLS